MAQQFRVLAAFPEDPSTIPKNSWHLTAMCNYSSWGANALSGLLVHFKHVLHRHTDTQAKQPSVESIFLFPLPIGSHINF